MASFGHQRETAGIPAFLQNASRDPIDSRTWDHQTATVIASVIKGLKIKTEYSFNDEETGGPDVENNTLLVQVEIKF